MSVFGVILVHIQSECGKIRTRITPNMDTYLYGYFFNAVEPRSKYPYIHFWIVFGFYAAEKVQNSKVSAIIFL